MNTPVASRAELLKEVKYRASYRGTLELDVVCRSLLPHMDALSDEELRSVAGLLQEHETDLMAWLVEAQEPPAAWKLTVSLLRHFFKNRERVA